MKAYKGFNKDMTCRGFQFKEGETYHEETAELCKSGFHASARNSSCLSARNSSCLSALDFSSLSAGKDSVIAAFNSKAKGGIGTLIALANRKWRNGEFIITDFKAAIVDGENIKADTWYTLKDGEFVEVDGE